MDWKWEFWTSLLKPLVPMLPLLAEKFDASKLCDSSCTVTEKGTINQVAAILKHDPDIAAVSELVRVVGSTIDEYVGLLETCWCHEVVWKNTKSWKRKRQQFTALHGHMK